MRKAWFIPIVFFCLLSCKEEVPDEMAIATEHPLATEIGAEVLRNGGNAIDAAVATHFALAVCLPRAGNIGGGGFAVVHADGANLCLDFRETAPLRSHSDMYLDSLGELIPNASLFGPGSAGIPGSVAGMVALHDSLGSMLWSDLIQPAIDLALNGYPLDEQRTEYLNRYQEQIKDWNPAGCAYIPLQSGLWEVGDRIHHPELALVLEEIRDHGANGFYSGWVADAMLREVTENSGFWGPKDLEQYQVVWRDPLVLPLGENTLVGMPPPSSGGIALYQLLYGAEKWDLRTFEPGSQQYTHLITEIMNRVFALRAGPMGDPSFYDVPLETLLDSLFLDSVMGDITMNKRSSAEELAHWANSWKESEETTHFCIVDREGNAISLTSTLNGNFGCKSVVDGCGFFLNNEMDDFSAKPGVPNQFGLIGYDANRIEPGKRMLSSMSPTIVLKDGSFFLATGSPGGSKIISSTFQTILQVILYEESAQGAIDQARMHSQWKPEVILYEENYLDQNTLDILTELGHNLQLSDDHLGRMEVIVKRPEGLEAASDTSRVQGKAITLP
jgi:gamma-glutamyltranspeptidase/glutathione hydrolase